MTPCDLYLTLPESPDPHQLRTILPPLLACSRVTALRLPVCTDGNRPLLAGVIALAHTHNVAAIATITTQESIEIALTAGSDGLHVTSATALEGLRARTGDDTQLGCLCATRDAAMLSGELGADYISFPHDQLDIVTWWTDVMELPAVVENVTSAEAARAAQIAGTDFLAVPLHLAESDTTTVNLILNATGG